MFRFSNYVLAASALLSLSSTALGATEFSVTVTDGPKECEDTEKVSSGQFLSMEYTGYIDDSSETGEKGSKFDSSIGRAPFEFQIGVGQVIQGWDQGLLGLCKGAKATLIIPPEMGYGAAGAGGVIPGGATLKFDVEVLGMSDDAPPEPNIFEMIDTNNDNYCDEAEILAYFQSMGVEEVPPELFAREDKDGDGKISWEEFSGPKGDKPPHDEL